MADENEIRALAQRYGEPARAVFEFVVLTPGFGDWVRNLTRRRGEIVLLVPRGAGRVLLHTKQHYPPGVFRLPTGGVRPGEAADDAARREAYEELGWAVRSLRLRGVLDNTFVIGSERCDYPSFVFETEEFQDTPAPTDPEEPISGFVNADKSGLREVARHLQSLNGGWREWGRFRAAAHVWLADQE